MPPSVAAFSKAGRTPARTPAWQPERPLHGAAGSEHTRARSFRDDGFTVVTDLNGQRSDTSRLAERSKLNQSSRTEALVAPVRPYMKIIDAICQTAVFHCVLEREDDMTDVLELCLDRPDAPAGTVVNVMVLPARRRN